MRPRNLTPDDETGTGRYSEHQIFNALCSGLRPRATPDGAITSGTPGLGNCPKNPDYQTKAKADVQSRIGANDLNLTCRWPFRRGESAR